jgi:REP element-mobilizing transposase RayT
MARPLRIEFAGASYHVVARGNAQGDIYTSNEKREKYLELLTKACKRFDWYCHACCQMSNHYHLLIETNTPTLSKGVKYLNGAYTQYFNGRNKRVVHLFQGRYKAILVQRELFARALTVYCA